MIAFNRFTVTLCDRGQRCVLSKGPVLFPRCYYDHYFVVYQSLKVTYTSSGRHRLHWGIAGVTNLTSVFDNFTDDFALQSHVIDHAVILISFSTDLVQSFFCLLSHLACLLRGACNSHDGWEVGKMKNHRCPRLTSREKDQTIVKASRAVWWGTVENLNPL